VDHGIASPLLAVAQLEMSFRSTHYVRHNARRLEHLASLQLPLSDRTVLELGAGIGDHTMFFLDRGCKVTAVEGRPENLEAMQRVLSAEPLNPNAERLYGEGADYKLVLGDLEHPEALDVQPCEVVHCYGLLYHVRDPLHLLEWIQNRCSDLLLLETCVSYPDGEADGTVLQVEEKAERTQALSGVGSRPTRPVLLDKLRELFSHVYVPRTQPRHEEFPVDWTLEQQATRLTRAVFVASHSDLAGNEMLLEELPLRYEEW
jgi:SAM-dependent methyltransferase